MFRQEMRVCIVEVGGSPRGTGFLVGPNAVLTNYHVVAEAIEQKLAGDRLTFLFDYRVLANGSLPAPAGRRPACPGPICLPIRSATAPPAG